MNTSGPDHGARVERLHDLGVLDTPPERLFDALTRTACLVTAAPISLVSLVDQRRQWFKSRTGPMELSETPIEIAFCAIAIRTDELLEISDAATDPRFADNPLVTRDGVRFYAGAPIVLDDGMRMGTLCVMDHVPRALTPVQRSVLVELAAAVAQALQQRSAAERQHETLRELEQSERERVREHVRLEHMLEATRAASWEWDLRSGEIRFDDRWAGMLGYTLAELEPISIATWRDLMHAEDLANAEPFFAPSATRQSPFHMFEARMRHMLGHWVWIGWRGRVSEWLADGRPATLIGASVDVTPRKEVEQQLRESQAFLDRTGRVAGVGGWEIDVLDGTLRLSEQACRIHEIPIGSELSLRESLSYYVVEARPVLEAAVRKCMSDAREWDLELPFVTANGRKIWVRVSGAAEMQGGRARWVIGALQDISVRKRAVLALELSEKRFRSLFENSLGLICTHDLDGTILSVNRALAQSLHYPVAEIVGRPLTDFMPREHHALFEEYLARIAHAGADSGTLHLDSADGTQRVWQYHNTLDNDGDIPFVLGHAQDITDRERMQKKLKFLSTRDPLTGCYNRRFLTELEGTVDDETWGCIAIDLDHFKRVNDEFGHQRGDEVLVAMARFLDGQLRADDVVIRAGGDEFLVLVRQGDETLTAAMCERILASRALAPISFTLGSAVRRAGITLEETLARADVKLYEQRAMRRE